MIKATTIRIDLQSDSFVQKPYASNLHGFCYHLAGENYHHPKYRPPSFHPYIKRWTSSKYGTDATILLSSIDERLTLIMLHNLENLKEIRLGHGTLNVVSFSIEKQEVIELDTKKATPVPNEFKILFSTPTTFRTRKPSSAFYESRAYPSLTYLVRSLSRYLHILFEKEISLEDQDELVEKITLVDAIAYPVQSRINRSSPLADYFIGEVHLICDRLSEEQKKLFGLLLKVAKYVGVGYKTGYGYGHIMIKKP